MSSHIIHTQKMMLTIERQQDWDIVQAKIGVFCNQELPALFDAIFNEVAVNDSIRIDKLTLNLGDVPLDRLEEIMKEQILSQMFNQLKEYKLSKITKDFTSNNEQLQLFKNAGKFTRRSLLNSNRVSNQIETHINDYEALVFYCETGLKPWWITAASHFKPAAILLDIYKYNSVLFIQFVNSICNDFVVYNRLRHLIHKSIFFTQYLSFDKNNDFLVFFNSNITPSLYQKIVDFWLADISISKDEIPDQQFQDWLIFFLKKNPSFRSEISTILKTYTAKRKTTKIQNKQFDGLSGFLATIPKTISKPLNGNMKKSTKVPLRKQQNGKLLLESLMVENAGLVIIHPFIKPLFERLEWLDGGAFKDDSSQQKAIVYLHYLVYDNYPEDESQLLLNKILCGAAIETVISLNDISFSEDQLSEADELKKAVIVHWNALGKSSPAALIENFFKRNGSLSYKDGNWNLNIERKGIDILLDRLPWGLTMIKLSWNKYLIQVNW